MNKAALLRTYTEENMMSLYANLGSGHDAGKVQIISLIIFRSQQGIIYKYAYLNIVHIYVYCGQCLPYVFVFCCLSISVV